MTGRTISHYEVLDKLGEGGMGVVYKARDTRLDRFVALKFLPPERVADPERKRRFIQEAKSASALNHPNIITVHDIDQHEGVDYIVMEFVAGKALDALIPRKGMRLSEALKIAVQIADALSAAHAAGIVHRDLKPGNVMVTESGLVKVLDFGLAKLTELPENPEEAPTLTAEGAIVGTVVYMSPEQAEGRKVDVRSDIFSFGSLLYEMLTGCRAFQGDSRLSTLSAIVNKEPQPLPPEVPGELAKLITRCLRKDSARRFQHMDDLKVALEDLKQESDSGSLARGPGVPLTHSKRRYLLAGAGLLVAVLAVLAWLFIPSRKQPEAAMTAVPLTTYAGEEYHPAFSPDGKQVAFSWDGEKQDNFDIYVQMIGSGRPLRLTDDPARDFAPAFSPDGSQIAFLRSLPGWKTGLFLVPPLGGSARKVAEISAERQWRSGSASSDDRWLATPISVNQDWHTGVAWSPDGRWLVVPDRDALEKPLALFLVSVDSGEKRRLTTPPESAGVGDLSAAFAPGGRALAFTRYMIGTFGDIYLLPLNTNLTPRGEPVRLTTESQPISRPAWTPDGREIVFSSGTSAQSIALWRIQAAGQAKPRRLDFAGQGAYQAAISPLGRRLAYTRLLQDLNIWAVETAGSAAGQAKHFISSTLFDFNPQYSLDGKRIAYNSSRSGNPEIWVCDADGSNSVQLTSFNGPDNGTPRWSPGGDYLVFDSMAAGNRDLYLVGSGGGKPRVLTTEPSQDRVPSWSHDGRWIYFNSNRGGDIQIWKLPWQPGTPAVGPAVQVTRNGGYVAFESPDGKTLYYTKSPEPGPLFKLPLDGGTESQVLESVYQRAFAVTAKGIYFIAAPDARGVSPLQFLDFVTGKTRQIAALDKPLYIGLTVSPDGRTILYSQLDLVGSDLMLVENFR